MEQLTILGNKSCSAQTFTIKIPEMCDCLSLIWGRKCCWFSLSNHTFPAIHPKTGCLYTPNLFSSHFSGVSKATRKMNFRKRFVASAWSIFNNNNLIDRFVCHARDTEYFRLIIITHVCHVADWTAKLDDKSLSISNIAQSKHLHQTNYSVFLTVFFSFVETDSHLNAFSVTWCAERSFLQAMDSPYRVAVYFIRSNEASSRVYLVRIG